MKDLFAAGLLFVSTSTVAQLMIPQTNTIRTPYGNATYTTYQRTLPSGVSGSDGKSERRDSAQSER